MKPYYTKFFQESWNRDTVFQKRMLQWNYISTKNWNWITLLDLFKLHDISEIESVLFNQYRVDLNTREWIDKFNLIIQNAINYYENFLFRTYGKNWKRKFSTKKDIIEFIRKTKESSPISSVHCTILKISHCVENILSNGKLKELDLKLDYFIENVIKKIFFVTKQEDEDCFEASYFDEKSLKQIKFKIMFRHKDWKKTLLKMLYNSNYSSSDELKDLFWIRIEVEDEQSALSILEKFYSIFSEEEEEEDYPSLFEKNDFKVQNKNLLSEESLITIQDNDEFKEFMQEVVTNNKKRKGETSKKYKDIKILTDILLPKNIEDINSMKEKYWLEIQIVLVDNKNESWFSHHWIFDAKKIISRMIRLQGYVSLVYINKVINETKTKNPDIKLSEEQILNHFLETFLLKRREDNSNKNFFITKERYKAFLQSWQVDLNNIHFFDYTKNEWI